MKQKQLLLLIPEKDHTEIKKRAVENGTSIKKYVLKAVAKMILEEERLLEVEEERENKAKNLTRQLMSSSRRRKLLY